MPTITVDQIDKHLRQLSPEKLNVVYDFVSHLLEQEQAHAGAETNSSARQTMLASEAVLRRDWDRPEEDTAWAHL